MGEMELLESTSYSCVVADGDGDRAPAGEQSSLLKRLFVENKLNSLL